MQESYSILILAWIILFIPLRDILTGNLLKWTLLLFIYSAGARGIIATGSSSHPMLLIITGYLAWCLFIPAAYLCLRNHFDQKRLGRRDIIHLLPVVLFGLGCSLAYLLAGDLSFIRFGETNHFSSLSHAGQAATAALRSFLYCLAAFYLWLVLGMILKNFRVSAKEKARPADPRISQQPNGITVKKNEKTQPVFLSDKKAHQMDNALRSLFKEKKPFLQQGYCLRQLAHDTNIPLHQLSAFINIYYKMNFNDLINEQRVAHSKLMIMKGECKYKKLETIAGESGFSSRNTFTIAFKKVTGLSPSLFLKKIKEAQQRQEDIPANSTETNRKPKEQPYSFTIPREVRMESA